MMRTTYASAGTIGWQKRANNGPMHSCCAGVWERDKRFSLCLCDEIIFLHLFQFFL